MANISPTTTIGQLDPNMTLEELAEELNRAGITGSKGRAHSSYGSMDYGSGFIGMFGTIVGNIADKVETIATELKDMDKAVMGLLDPWAKADAAASKYAKTIGTTKAMMDRIRDDSIHAVVQQHIGLDFGMNAEDLIAAQTNYAKGIGRNIRLGQEDQTTLAAITSVYDDSSEMFNAFDKIGVGMDGVGKHMGKMYADAAKSGISLEKYADNVKEGLAAANRFTFRNGLKGMEAMAKRAAAIRMDMQQVESFAGSFDNIEKSISNAARLQVLGGPFAAGADALGLLNDSLTDLEGLEKRMEGFTAGMGKLNKQTGEVEIDAHNMWRLKEFANITGQDAAKVVEVARRQAMRGEIDTQLQSSSNFASLDDDFKELIRNTATFKDGKAGVTIDGHFKEISELTNKDQETLIKETQDQSADIKDIARDVRSLVDIRTGFRKQLEGQQANMTGALGRGLKNLTRWISGFGNFVNGILGAIVGFKYLTTGLQLWGGGVNIWNTVKSFKDVFRGTPGTSSSRILNRFGRGSGNISSVETSSSRIVRGKGAQGNSWFRNLFNRPKSITNVAGNQYTKVGSRVFNAQGKELFGAAKANALKLPKGTAGLKGMANLKNTLQVGKTVRKAKQVANLVKAGKGMSVLASAGGKVMTKIPVIGSLLSAGITAYENKDKFKDKATRGSAIGKTVGAGAGAAVGAALGTLLGPLGTVVGGIAGEWIGKKIGGAIGKIQDKRVEKNRAVVDSQLSRYGIERKGDYGVKSLKNIDKALQTGELSNSMRRKLLKQGDADMVAKIDEIKKQKEVEKEAKRDKKIERLKQYSEMIGNIRGGGKKHINKATFIVQHGIFSGNGIKQRGGGLFSKVKKAAKTFGTVNDIIKGDDETGVKFKKLFGAVFNKNKDAEEKEATRSGEPFKVDISGTINLRGANGESVDLLAEIKKNPTLLAELSELVMRNWKEQQHGGYAADTAFGTSRI